MPFKHVIAPVPPSVVQNDFRKQPQVQKKPPFVVGVHAVVILRSCFYSETNLSKAKVIVGNFDSNFLSTVMSETFKSIASATNSQS